jgi:hypothetical protein
MNGIKLMGDILFLTQQELGKDELLWNRMTFHLCRRKTRNNFEMA